MNEKQRQAGEDENWKRRMTPAGNQHVRRGDETREENYRPGTSQRNPSFSSSEKNDLGGLNDRGREREREREIEREKRG